MRNELLGKEEDGGDGSLIMERVMWAFERVGDVGCMVADCYS